MHDSAETTAIARPARGVFAPDQEAQPPHRDSEGGRRQALIVALIALVLIAGAGLAIFAFRPGAAPPVIAAGGPYKEPGPVIAAEAAPDSVVFDLMEGEATPTAALDAGAAPVAATPPEPPPTASAETPVKTAFDADGPWLAQVAALRSEAAAREAWTRLQDAYPELMAGARMDIQRADLGPQGVYFRLRAGYFPAREQASAFCDRLKQAGRDCLAAAR